MHAAAAASTRRTALQLCIIGVVPMAVAHRGMLTRGSCDLDFGSSATSLQVITHALASPRHPIPRGSLAFESAFLWVGDSKPKV